MIFDEWAVAFGTVKRSMANRHRVSLLLTVPPTALNTVEVIRFPYNLFSQKRYFSFFSRVGFV